MHYVKSFDRNQMMMATWDSMVDPESTARLIDAFVNSLDVAGYGIKEISSEGSPHMIPGAFLRSIFMEVRMASNHLESLRRAVR